MSFEHTAEAVHQELKDNGFYAWPSMVSEPQLARFEQDMSALSESLATKLGVSHEGDRGIITAFERGGQFRHVLYNKIQGMEVLSEITRYAMKTVSDLGLLEALGFDLPSVQTNLRVDLPNEEKFMLPMHQDYASMRSHKAVRIWLPLRSVDKNNGTMTVVPGSNNEGPLEHNTNDANPVRCAAAL